MNILDFAASQGWAMLPERASELVSIAERASTATPEVLEAYRAATLDRAERAKVRGSIAILHVEGPLFKKANLFVEMSGATSYDILRRDLQAALDNPAIHSILLVIDSPGGEANGCDELATAIFEARSKKPITAFVSGMAASGGYWIASAASRIVISEASMVGSIGVVLGIQDRSAADEKRGVKNIEFVSSQSPGKRPDPSTDEGRNRIQTMVDDLAGVFIAAVAKHRGKSAETVRTKFGAGGMVIGAKAVAAGMADEIGQLEAVIASLSKTKTSEKTGSSANVNVIQVPEVDRFRAILTSPHGKAFPSLSDHLAFNTGLPAEQSLSIMAAFATDADNHAATLPASSTNPTASSADYMAAKAKAGAIIDAYPANTVIHAADVWKKITKQEDLNK